MIPRKIVKNLPIKISYIKNTPRTNLKMIYTYYFTDDLLNPKEIHEINLLKEKFEKLIIVTTTKNSIKGQNLHYLRIKKIDSNLFIILNLWMKFSYLASKIAESKTDKYFPKRNVYSSNILTRKIVNIVWALKKIPQINRCLPYYEDICLFPIKILNSIGVKRRIEKKRMAIINSLIIHQPLLIFAINSLKLSGVKIIANVKSWDNPFYTQLYRSADFFIVWSEHMWQDIIKVHKIKNKNYLILGSRIFDDFYSIGFNKFIKNEGPEKGLVIGYACAYGKELLGDAEIQLIKLIAEKSLRDGGQQSFLIRPYPTVDKSHYTPLLKLPNVVIQEIEGQQLLRYNFSKERINFGNPFERLSFLRKCDVFMSLGTSFTVEAAIFGIPIFHYFLDKNSRSNKFEKLIFERTDISDHILNYFNTSLPLVNNIKIIDRDFIDNNINNGSMLLEKMGVGIRPIENIKNFMET